MKKLYFVLVAIALSLSMLIIPAEARKAPRKANRSPAAVQVHIDISSQSMSVRVNGSHYGSYKVSTARSGYYTPRGSYGVTRMARMHYSRKYDNAPMPHSIFFLGGYAIHGTNHVRNLGRPASHGCVRLAPGNAAALYSLVQRHGGRARITLTN